VAHPLPDVDESGYDDWQNQLFQEDATRKIQDIGLTHWANDRMADLTRLGAWATGSPPEAPPAPEPAPTPAPPADMNMPPDVVQQVTAPGPPPADMSMPADVVDQMTAPGPGPVPMASLAVASPPPAAAPTPLVSPAGGAAVSPNPAPGPSPVFAGRSDGLPDWFPSLPNWFPGQQQPQPSLAPPTVSAAQPGGPLQDYARQAALKAGIDPDIFVRQIQQESGFNPNARSPAGATGVAQFMPATAQGMGVDPTDPYQSLEGAARLMASHLQQYGGDYSKALAAYNAGPGNVAKYGGVPPFEETQRYVNTILGGTSPRTTPTPTEGLGRAGAAQAAAQRDISQFGDPQLTNDEAYAACGPAAAVRFAQRFGRNPTLREATDLARTVGWTSAQGMAGLGSEKALMDKLGVPTKLVSGADWGTFANEARTGNPVTISTQGHYFTADGWDPQTNRFHVGRSGLDLKGGSEWMTPEQMTAIMGPVQGGLLADNPQVPAPSIADQDTNPVGWLDRAKQAMADSLAPPKPKPEAEIAGASVRPELSSVISPMSETLGIGEPYQQAAAVSEPQSLASPKSPLEEMSSNIANAITSGLKNLGIGAEPAQPVTAPGAGYDPSALRAVTEPPQPGIPLRQDVRDLGITPQPTLADRLGQTIGDELSGERARRAREEPYSPEFQARAAEIAGLPPPQPTSNPLEMLGGASLGMAPLEGEAVDRARQEWIAENNPLRDVPVVGGATTLAADIATDPTNLVLGLPYGARAAPEVAERAAQALEQRAPAVGEFLANEEGALTLPFRPARAADDPYVRALETPANQGTKNMLEAPLPEAEPQSLTNRFVRAWTNRFEGVDRYQEDALKGAGLDPRRPPEALDVSAQIRELATDHSVKLAEDQYIKPAIQALGGDETARKVLSSYLIHNNNVDVAAALGKPYREFPGGGSLMESQRALREMQAALGPEEWAKLQDAGRQVYGLVGELRDRMLQSGLIEKYDYNMWKGQYPRWVPTRILDYLDEGGGPRIGSKISLGDNGVRAYTEEGTSKFREDPLASVLGLVAQVERNARKNEAVSQVLGLDQLGGTPPRILPTDAPVKTGESVIQHVKDGVVQRYVAPPDVAAVINGPMIDQAPGFVRDWVNFQRGVTTVFSPAFALLRNPSLDVPLYLQRSMAREGGNPLRLKRLVGALIDGYGDAFQGLRQNEFRGEGTQRYLAGGGSGSTLVSTAEQRAREIQNLAEGSSIELKSGSDIARAVRGLLEPVQRVAERTELGPRVAAMKLAEERGATPKRAILEGRNVTIDFNEGGTLSKTLNSFIPFFNVGPQDVAQVQRMFAENPKGAAASMAMLVGLPQVLAEAWNRSDPQRSKDYDNVPQSIKRQGPVIMLPTEAPVDKDGNRHPQYWSVNFGARAGFADIARQAAEGVMQSAGVEGAKPEDWQNLLSDILWSAAPVRGSSPADVPRQLIPEFIPGTNTATQLALNREFFRGTQISTERTNREASQAGRELAGALTNAARQIDPKYEITPSQVDFAVKDMLGSWGEMGLGARAMLPGAEPQQGNEPQKVPVIGGALKALGVRGDIGETGRQARENLLTPSGQRFLQSQGVEYVPSPVASDIEGVPLLRDEETLYQHLANRYLDDEIHKLEQNGKLAARPAQDRTEYVQQVASETREKAAAEVVKSIGQDEIRRRVAKLKEQGKR